MSLVAAVASCEANGRENRRGDKEEEIMKGTRRATGTNSWSIKSVAVFGFLWHVWGYSTRLYRYGWCLGNTDVNTDVQYQD